jgi:hypothetical protein
MIVVHVIFFINHFYYIPFRLCSVSNIRGALIL